MAFGGSIKKSIEKNTQNFLDTSSPPSDFEAEIAIIGGIFFNGSIMHSLLDILSLDDFYYNSNKIFYGACLDLYHNNTPVDLISIKNKLEEKNLFNEVGGETTLIEYTQNLPFTSNVEFYANIVKEKSIRRKLLNIAKDISLNSLDLSKNIDEILNGSEHKIYEIAQKKNREGFFSNKDLVFKVFSEIEENLNSGNLITGVSTGYKPFDDITSGLQKSDLIIVAGRPGMGKTAFALNLAFNCGMKSNSKIAFFSLEMSKEQLMMREIAIAAGIPLSKLRIGKLDDSEMKRVYLCMDKLVEINMFIDDSPVLNTLELRSKCRRLKSEIGLDIVFVDYLQLMKSSRNIDAREQEIADISRNLKVLAKELSIPVVALSQLNRRLEERSDKRPMLSDLRESGAIEQDADLIVFLYREEIYNKNSNKKNIAEIIIGKQRNGPTGGFDLFFNPVTNAFKHIVNM